MNPYPYPKSRTIPVSYTTDIYGGGDSRLFTRHVAAVIGQRSEAELFAEILNHAHAQSKDINDRYFDHGGHN